jgi:hypothetical protein
MLVVEELAVTIPAKPLSTEILTAQRSRSNAELIVDVAALVYLEGTVLDVTFGEGVFWRKHRPDGLRHRRFEVTDRPLDRRHHAVVQGRLIRCRRVDLLGGDVWRPCDWTSGRIEAELRLIAREVTLYGRPREALNDGTSCRPGLRHDSG